MKHSAPKEKNAKYEEWEEEDYAYFEVDEDDEIREHTSASPLVVGLGVIAGLCVVLLAVLIFVSFSGPSANTPKVSATTGNEDPASQLHIVHIQEEAVLKEKPMETEETEETTEPTIPPEANPFNQYDFQYNRHNYLSCLRQESYVGVDVSAFQGDIDWAQVKASGIQFAMLRLGYRGWGAKGTLVEDEYIQKNLAGTAAVELPVGAYFFSQATSVGEVWEEIEFMLGILGDYRLEYPIVLDWEVADPNGRINGVTRRELTDMLLYFCEEMSGRGFDPMVYFNWTQSSRMLYLNELEDYPFWLALYQDRMTYPFRVEMWQYTNSGTVPGIAGEVDINLYIPDLLKD